MDKGGNILDQGGNILDLGGNILDLGGNILDLRINICPAPFLIALFSNHHLYSPSQSLRNFVGTPFWRSQEANNCDFAWEGCKKSAWSRSSVVVSIETDVCWTLVYFGLFNGSENQ